MDIGLSRRIHAFSILLIFTAIVLFSCATKHDNIIKQLVDVRNYDKLDLVVNVSKGGINNNSVIVDTILWKPEPERQFVNRDGNIGGVSGYIDTDEILYKCFRQLASSCCKISSNPKNSIVIIPKVIRSKIARLSANYNYVTPMYSIKYNVSYRVDLLINVLFLDMSGKEIYSSNFAMDGYGNAEIISGRFEGHHVKDMIVSATQLLIKDGVSEATYDAVRKIIEANGDNMYKLLSSVKKNELEKNTLASILELEVKYSDKASILPNDIIDAGEYSNILLIVRNNGKGTAFDVKLYSSSDYKRLNFPLEISLGDIPPSETKEVSIPIKGGLDLESGKVLFEFSCAEKRGYDSKKVKVLIRSSPAVS